MEASLLYILLVVLVFIVVISAAWVRKLLVEKRKYQEELGQITSKYNEAQRQTDILHALIQVTEEGVFVCDIHQKVTFSNRQASEMLGLDPLLVKDKSIYELLPVEQLKGKLAAGIDAMVSLRGGGNKKLRIKSMPLLSNEAEVGTIYTIYDLSKEAELEEIKFDLIAMTAHQLRTPLTILNGYLSILAKTINEKLSAPDQELYRRAMSGSERLRSLIESLLKTNRFESGKLSLTLVPTLLDDVVQKIIMEQQGPASLKKVSVVYNKPAQVLPPIKMDRALMETALSNLVINAIEHSQNNSQVVISATVDRGALVVNVQDTGEGIPSSAIPYLFTKFYKVPNNLVQNNQGFGLGLYFARMIVEAHGGKIWVNSILDKGATFGLAIPMR